MCLTLLLFFACVAHIYSLSVSSLRKLLFYFCHYYYQYDSYYKNNISQNYLQFLNTYMFMHLNIPNEFERNAYIQMLEVILYTCLFRHILIAYRSTFYKLCLVVFIFVLHYLSITEREIFKKTLTI